VCCRCVAGVLQCAAGTQGLLMSSVLQVCCRGVLQVCCRCVAGMFQSAAGTHGLVMSQYSSSWPKNIISPTCNFTTPQS